MSQQQLEEEFRVLPGRAHAKRAALSWVHIARIEALIELTPQVVSVLRPYEGHQPPDTQALTLEDSQSTPTTPISVAGSKWPGE